MRIIILTLIVCLGATITKAQNLISGTEVLSKNNYPELSSILKDYKIYKINVEKKNIKISSKTPLLDLELGEESYHLNLFQNNLQVSYRENGEGPLLLGGSMRSGGSVSLTINDNFLYGFIKQGAMEKFIEPLHYLIDGADQDLFLIYNYSDVKEDKKHVCGVDETMHRENNIIPSKMITSCKVLDMAIATTFDMITKYGSNMATENHNLGVLNNVQTNYRSEFDANYEFNVVAHYFPTSTSNNPLTPLTTTSDASTLLSNFTSWASAGGSCSGPPCWNTCGGGDCGGANGGFGIDYTIASLWTDRDITFGGNSGTVGLAYTPGWHHILEDFSTSGASLAAMTTHEIGHNFDADHDASGSNFIMAPSVTLTSNWSAASKTAINNRLNPITYLNNCSTLGAPVANFNKGATAVCSGNTIEFEDQSQYGATRTWEFTGGTPATSTSEKPVVTYNTPGLYAVKLTSTNSAGSSTYFDYVDIESVPPTPCTPSGGTGGSGGITLVNVGNLSHGSTTTGLYEDNACEQVATLSPSTSYTLVVGVSGVTRLRYFIDYNNDGNFTGSGESSGMYTFSGNGNLGVGLTTPSAPTLETMLRMRVIVSTASISSDGCSSPTTGQVEDYSVYFPATQILGCTDPAASNYNPNATVDDGTCATGTTTWYADTDNDNFGDINNTTTAASQPPNYVADNTDCDDTDNTVYPGAPELCDNKDNDCDNQIDEGVTTTYYLDNDSDGFGDPNVSQQACSTPTGYVTDNTDCDDNDGNNYPGNTEVCDGQDNNCNGQIDEGVTTTYYFDFDGDGYGNPNVSQQACSSPANYVTDNTDCDDNDANNFPGNTEICDGQDNNCNGQIDEGVSATTYYLDNDGDGFGDINNSQTTCIQPAGYVTNSNDCDDSDNNNYPGNTEVCDGQDNNCNVLVDEGVTIVFFLDNDGDGFGDSNNSISACTAPSGYVSNDTDCDDNDNNNYPGNTEICDGQDNNCDGIIDEGCGGNSTCDGSYLVINVITQSTYRAEVSIESSATITSAFNQLFTAGSEIELLPGFEVIQGAEFEAKIEACTVTMPSSGNTNNAIQELILKVKDKFNANEKLNATILSNNNATQLNGFIETKDLADYLNKHLYNLEKGTYKLVLSTTELELVEDIIIIK